MQSILQSCVNLLFPSQCCVCQNKSKNIICESCLEFIGYSPKIINENTLIVFNEKGNIRNLINIFKNMSGFYLVDLIAVYVCKAIIDKNFNISNLRYSKRLFGYNPSKILCKKISSILNIPINKAGIEIDLYENGKEGVFLLMQ